MVKPCISWLRAHMPILNALSTELSERRPFSRLTIGICLRIDPKTAVLCSTLQAGGALR